MEVAEEAKTATATASAHIDTLPDLTLQLVFLHLSPGDLAHVAQVCRRWRDLSGAPRLWSKKSFVFNHRSTDECRRAVAMLGRSHGVHPFTRLDLRMESRTGLNQRIAFGAGAEELTVQTSSSLMLLLCLRHLLPQRVTTLRLTASYIDALTPFEARVVWETIASKEFVVDLSFTLHRGGALFLCPFQWPRPGFLTYLRFNAVGNAPAGTTVCAPVRSLIKAHRYQLLSLRVLTEDQQPLLDLCPRSLRHLDAVLLPGLVKVLWQLRGLHSLSLRSHFTSPGVLAAALAMPWLQHRLWDLDVVIAPGHWEDDTNVPEMATLLRLLKQFPHLSRVRLIGMALPPRSRWDLRALLQSLPLARSLALDEEPCGLDLQGLVPAEEGAESPVPESLRLLTLEHGGHFAAAKHPVAEGWLAALRQVLRAAPRLHVRVDRSACTAARRLDKVVILPHPVDQHCQDCPGKAAQKEGFTTMFIEDISS